MTIAACEDCMEDTCEDCVHVGFEEADAISGQVYDSIVDKRRCTDKVKVNWPMQLTLNGLTTAGRKEILDMYVKDIKDAAPNTSDPVKHPKHYKFFDTEAIDIIKSALTDEEFLGYIKGNSLKYRLRAGKKDDVTQDINKAKQYEEMYNR